MSFIIEKRNYARVFDPRISIDADEVTWTVNSSLKRILLTFLSLFTHQLQFRLPEVSLYFFLVCVDERIGSCKQCRNICYLKYFIRESLFVSLSEDFVLFNGSDKISNKELGFFWGTGFSAQRHKTWQIFFLLCLLQVSLPGYYVILSFY